MRQISLATGKAPRALESVGPPSFPRADRVFGLENQFWPMGPHPGAEAARQVRQLETLRARRGSRPRVPGRGQRGPRAEHYWRKMNRCHRHIHQGLLQVEGETPQTLRWLDRQGRELGTPLQGLTEPITFEEEFVHWLASVPLLE